MPRGHGVCVCVCVCVFAAHPACYLVSGYKIQEKQEIQVKHVYPEVKSGDVNILWPPRCCAVSATNLLSARILI